MDVLEQHGLLVSMGKTVILLRLVGHLKCLIVSQHGSEWIALHCANTTSWTRVVERHVYLGVYISFGAFEKYTLKHRLARSSSRPRPLRTAT